MRPGAAQANASSRPEQLDFWCGQDEIDESAGWAEETRVYQLTELPGDTFEDIFGDAA